MKISQAGADPRPTSFFFEMRPRPCRAGIARHNAAMNKLKLFLKVLGKLSSDEAFFFSTGIGNLYAQDLQACRVRSGRP